MKITINDRQSYAIQSQRVIADNGFLKVPGRVARTGIQEYLASELGLTDRAPNEIVKVMRPAEEVFKDESLNTYSDADVTIEHPPEMVNAGNYAQYSKGNVCGAATQDGDFVVCDMLVRDQSAIDAVNGGKVQLSAGYTAIYDSDVPADAGYDFIQRDIIINHVALVQQARAGAQARLFDNKPKEKRPMAVKLVLDGLSVNVEDDDQAKAVSDHVAKLTAEATKQQVTIDSLKEELEEARKASSDSVLAERMSTIVKAKSDCSKLAGASFSCDSMAIVDNYREALKIKRPKVDWADKSDVYVQVAFDQAKEKMEDQDEDEEDEMESKDASYRQLSKDAAGAAPQRTTPVKSSYQKIKDASDIAWKKTAGMES